MQVISGSNKKIVIIGGGIAGCSTAYSLAKRGYHVTIIERNQNIALEASGNPAGVIMPVLAREHDPLGQFSLASYKYITNLLQENKNSCIKFDTCGVLQLDSIAENRKRKKSIVNELSSIYANVADKVTASQASEISGVDIKQEAVYFKDGAWVNPVSLCEFFTSSYAKNIEIIYNSEVISLAYSNDYWQIYSDGKILQEANIVIVASAKDMLNLKQANWLPLQVIRGQLTYLSATEESKKLQSVVMHDGITIPAINNIHVVGASFHINDICSDLRESDEEENIANSMLYLKSCFANCQVTEQRGRVGFRTASPDRLPMVGRVADYNCIINSGLRRKDVEYIAGKSEYYHNNLYVNTAHGSRGITSAPYAAEILASVIFGGQMSEKIIRSLDPMRFIVRKLRRELQ
jgi:tRNA 5-methylaminomethyl-2-thiouridine biosynthesis bifunctional protein